MTAMIKKYTTKDRTFEISPDNTAIYEYVCGRLFGIIFNNDWIVTIDGDEVVSSEFFK